MTPAETPSRVGDTPAFHAARRPDDVAVEFHDQTLTWRGLEALTARLARALIGEGVCPGDRVGHLGRNSDVMLALFYATARIGAVFVPLNWRLARAEISYILGDAGTRLVFVADEFRSQVEDAPGLVFTHMTHRAPEQGLGAWLDAAEDDAPALSCDPAPKDTVVQLYTSGTTGRPKGALLSQAYFVDGAAMFLSHPESALRLRPGEFAPVTMPMFHVGGLNFCFVMASQGRGLIVLDEYDPAVVLRLIDQGRIAIASGVPTMLQGLIEHPAAASTDFASLRYYTYGAAPMPPPLLRRAIEVMGCEFASMYGLTEASGVTYLAPSDHDPAGSERMGSVGRPLPGVDLRIVDAAGQPLPVGEVGEIAIRSPQLLTGYWRMPEATADAFADGYFRTGDAACVDADGYVFLKDRVKDMIISGGENIYPAEVEFVLYSHPDIQEAAVIGMPDPRWGEVPKAYVVARPGAVLDLAAIRSYVAERIAKFKTPREYEVLEALPRNAAGKVLKRNLREAPAGDNS